MIRSNVLEIARGRFKATSIQRQAETRELVRFREGLFLASSQTKIESKLLAGSYDSKNLTFCRSVVREGCVCADVGANIGVYTTLLGIWSGPSAGAVHAFEPVPHVRSRLTEHVLINGLKNVRVNAMGVANVDGTLPMKQVRPGEFRAGTSTFLANENVDALGAASFEEVPVSVVRLDGYATTVGLTRLDFVKIDVEGFELSCLQGAIETLRRFKPIVLMEHNQRRLRHLRIDEKEFRMIAVECGYRFYELLTAGERVFMRPFAFDRNLRSNDVVGLASSL